MKIIQVTLGAGATPVSAQRIPVQQAIFQNNSANAVRVGDASVSATKGILLASGSPGGSLNMAGFMVYGTDLSLYYLFGISGNVVDILYEV
jgi:hypothetical protein